MSLYSNIKFYTSISYNNNLTLKLCSKNDIDPYKFNEIRFKLVNKDIKE